MMRSRYLRTRPKPSRRHPLYRSCKPSEYVSHWRAAALTKPCHKPVPLAPKLAPTISRRTWPGWKCIWPPGGAAQQTSHAAGTAKWEQAAVAQARAIGQAHPAATARRAETMLARSIVQSGGSEGPRATLLAAQSLYRAGRLDEALAAFDKAAHRAAAIEDTSATFDAHYSAAALEQERGNHAEALARFLNIARAMPANPRAAAAHLLAIHSAAQLARRQTTPQLDEYGQLLREHLARWPDAKTAPQAWCWRGRLAEQQGAWQEAIAALAHVAPRDPQYAEAVEATGRCYLAALAEMRSRGNANDLLARDAVTYLQKVIGPAGSPYSPASRAAVLALARVYLTEMRGAAAKANELLRPALAANADAPAAWRSAASMLHAAALAAGGDIAAAQRALVDHPPEQCRRRARTHRDSANRPTAGTASRQKEAGRNRAGRDRESIEQAAGLGRCRSQAACQPARGNPDRARSAARGR